MSKSCRSEQGLSDQISNASSIRSHLNLQLSTFGSPEMDVNTSASTTDLSGGFDSGGSSLRKSPDQYSSRGSMESLDPPQSSQLHSGAQHHHLLGHHTYSGPHPTYSSCHQLSSARSSNSIDHLHSKRDSAYSSFSTSSSIPEYLASTPSFSPERSYSLETVPQRGGGSGEMQQADIHYIRTVYDAQQGLSQEHELNSTSAALLHNCDSRGGGGARAGLSQDVQGSLGGVCYRGSSSGSSSGGVPASNRHSVGPIWSPAATRSSYESLKGVPAPPRRSDSYAAIRNHERPNSWSSLEHARSLRSLQKGSWHHSSGPVASGAAKGSYGTECQLHTVIEKSPESSPTTKPRQGGGFPQPLSPPEPSTGPGGPTTQSGWLIFPTGVYPVPQPEPHYAQMPSSNPGAGSSAVYPALAKESSRQQHQGLQGFGGKDEGGTGGHKDGKISVTENGHQNNISTSPYLHSPTSASSQLRTQAHEAERPQQEESHHGHYKSHMKIAGGRSEGQTGSQRPNHQEPHSQSFQGSYTHKSQGPHSHAFQEQNHGFHIPHIQSTRGPRPLSSHEWRDPYTPVQSRGDRSRSLDQTSIHSDPVVFSRPTQGQVLPTHLSVHPQPQAPPTSDSQTSPCHLSESAALQYQHWDQRERGKDREHPLTRLEIALAEVQQCTISDSAVSGSNHSNSSLADGSQGPARSLSVLEKVSRFERQERAGKLRCHSINNAHNKATQLRMSEKGHSTPCGADDLRNMLEKSTNGTKAHRTLSYRGGSSDHMKYRTPTDPSSALQRSRSSFQLDESSDSSKDFPQRQDMQEMLGSMQDTSSNRSYRESLKDAQSKVLRSTSFRRRDLSSSVSPPPAAPPPVSSPSSHQPPPVPAKLYSLEKKGPKTMPKPQGIIITAKSPPLVTSPHTPKERHVVSPEIRGTSPPALPSVPPVGPPALIRICGRKRLAADQKKRSYSEPENMNEVGVSDTETAALFRRGGETSVADRRKMFELAASCVRGGPTQNATSRPDLRQLQHNALAEYLERKRGIKRDEGGKRSGPRPRSAYLQPENSNHTASSCYSETLSLSSASSLLSLQDSGSERNFYWERRLCSTLPSGVNLRNLQSNMFYPGRVTTPRPPAHPPHSAPPGSPPEIQAKILQGHTPEAGLSRHSQSLSRDPGLPHQQQDAESQLSLGLSKQLNGALQRAWSDQSSGKSTSAEDLLERSEETQTSLQHYRSCSSPAVETLNQDFPPGDIRMFGVFMPEPGCWRQAEDRPVDIQVSGSLVSPQPSQNSLNTVQPEDPGSFIPVTRRERQRNIDRQRAHSTSTLAASVGLPCPFFPPGTKDGSGTDWQASERLSLASLGAITFPGILQTSTGDSDGSKGAAVNTTSFDETLVMDRQTRHSLSDASILEDTEKEMYRGRAYSLEMRGGHSAENPKQVSAVMATPLSLSQLAPPPDRKESNFVSSPSPTSLSSIRHLSSLRISESCLFSSTDQQQPLETSTVLSQEDFDEVFLQNPASLSPPPPSIMEDFLPPLPPPPPLELEQETGNQSVESPSSEFLNNSSIPTRESSLPTPPTSISSSVFPPPVLSTISTFTTTEDSLGFEYQPLPKREKTSEELQVEALARQLVLQDSSLVPLLDTWGAKSTVELMEEIFPNSKLVDKSQWQHRGRIQDGICNSAPRAATDGETETNLDEVEKDLNTRKVELCEALRNSVDALQQEKEVLCEEQRHHQALGAGIETLVQERLKTNERDKYSMFIGDLEKIVNLLLSLCSRLSRIDRSLLALEREELTQEDTAEERDSLHHKRRLLLRQTEDAWELKENLDKRQQVVHAILSGYLTEPQLQDYRQFVSTKPSFLIRRRHLEDLIRQGEEQLTRLAESLPAKLAEAHGWSRSYPFLLPNPVPCSSPFPPLFPQSVMPGPVPSVRSTTVTSL